MLDLTVGKPAKLKFAIKVTDPLLTGFLLTIDDIQNDMIPAGNDMFLLVQNKSSKPKVIFYQQVIPIKTWQGEKGLFNSPIFNINFRKMLYFVANK